METPETTSEVIPPRSAGEGKPTDQDKKAKQIIAVVVIAAVFILAGLIVAIWYLMQSSTPTDRIRDIFIIVVALESLVIGVALVILIVQLASLINLLQNEVRPILTATSETVNNLRGTAEFLGESVVEPVIKLNGYLAGMNRLIEMMGINKKK